MAEGVQAGKLVLPEFSGNREESKIWFGKFKLLATKFKWTPEEKILQMALKLTSNASIWFSTLSETEQADWAVIEDRFVTEFVTPDNKIIIMTKLL